MEIEPAGLMVTQDPVGFRGVVVGDIWMRW